MRARPARRGGPAPLGGRALHGAVRSTHACSRTARLWFHKAAGDSSSLARQPGGALALGMPLGIVIFVRPHRPGGEEDEDQKERPAHHSASTCVRVDEGGAAGRTRGGAPWFQAGVVPLAASEQGPCSGKPLGSHPRHPGIRTPESTQLQNALVGHLPWGVPYWAASDGEVTHVTASESSAAPRE